MAFNIFKKKDELDYPEEKASVLEKPFDSDGLPTLAPPPEISPEPTMGELPPPPRGLEMPPIQHEEQNNFKAGFVPMEKMAPPEPRSFEHAAPISMEDSMSASLSPPEHQFPELRRESIFNAPPRMDMGIEKPHVFIRINKYKDVMDSLNELHRRVQDGKTDLEELNSLNTEESNKLRETAEIVLKIEDILKYLETTFTSPEA